MSRLHDRGPQGLKMRRETWDVPADAHHLVCLNLQLSDGMLGIRLEPHEHKWNMLSHQILNFEFNDDVRSSNQVGLTLKCQFKPDSIRAFQMSLKSLGPAWKVILQQTQCFWTNEIVKMAICCRIPRVLIKVDHLNSRSSKIQKFAQKIQTNDLANESSVLSSHKCLGQY